MSRNCENSNFTIVFAPVVHRKYNSVRVKQYTAWNDKSQVTIWTIKDNKTQDDNSEKGNRKNITKSF